MTSFFEAQLEELTDGVVMVFVKLASVPVRLTTFPFTAERLVTDDGVMATILIFTSFIFVPGGKITLLPDTL